MFSGKNIFSVQRHSIISLHFPLFRAPSIHISIISTSSFTCIHIMITSSFLSHMHFQFVYTFRSSIPYLSLKGFILVVWFEYELYLSMLPIVNTALFSDIRDILINFMHRFANHNSGSITRAICTNILLVLHLYYTNVFLYSSYMFVMFVTGIVLINALLTIIQTIFDLLCECWHIIYYLVIHMVNKVMHNIIVIAKETCKLS